MRKRILLHLAAIAAAVLLALTGCARDPGRRIDIETEQTAPAPETVPETGAEIMVYVCGYVKEPGVYRLPEGARAYDAVSAAGGFLPGADTEFLNLAEKLTDGEKLRIPSPEEAQNMDAAGGADDGMVNINTAGADELMTLPGIGPAKADAIIAYREREGAFSVIEDIMLVPGIKEAAFSRIKDHIRV